MLELLRERCYYAAKLLQAFTSRDAASAFIVEMLRLRYGFKRNIYT